MANTGTVRLLYPQWQGGNFGHSYPLGARLLAWLAPASDAPLFEVPVEEYTGTRAPVEDGIFGRDAITRSLRAARAILEAQRPDRVVTFGGDCLVSQAPFAYLNGRYDGQLGILWIDAHPDITTPESAQNSHAMVLGNLLGEGDPALAAEVERPVDPSRVLYAGVNDMLMYEWETFNRLGLGRVRSDELADNSEPVLRWLRERGVKHLAIHWDLDVLDPRLFRSLMFNMPTGETIDAERGRMTLGQVTRLIQDVSAATDVVGLTFAEHMPWDDINLKTMMEALPIMHQ